MREDSYGVNTNFHRGSDHAIGVFFDISDRRYANSKDDLQGEGYVMEWSSLFGFTNNLIGATEEDLRNPEVLQAKVEAFIESKGYYHDTVYPFQ